MGTESSRHGERGERGERKECVQTAPLDAIFNRMDLPFAETVVERAVKYRGAASPSAKKALNAAVRASVKVKGFRDASRATPKQLIASTLYEIDHGDHRLAGAVLKVWDESQSELRRLVSEHLANKNIPVHDANIKRRHFEVSWGRGEWLGLRDELLERHDHLDGDDIALMLCLASGRMHGQDEDSEELALESPRFERWLEELERLPSDADEWRDAEVFADYVVGIAHGKIDDFINGHTAALEAAINGVREKFTDELRYLDIDMGSWFKDASVRLPVMPGAEELVARLKEQMQKYHPIRPQAAVRDEEKRRLNIRARCEEDIFDTVRLWQELMSCPADPPPARQVAEARGEYRTTPDAGDGQGSGSSQELQALRAKVDGMQESNERLKAENARLEEAKNGIQLEKAQLNEQIGQLKSQLVQSQKAEQYWRQAYVGEKGRTDANEMELGVAPSNVGQVIDRIGRAFPDEIVFALNGKSRKNHPFQKPDELYQALAWLATEFYHLRPDPGPSPDFDRLIKEACPGWSYKPNQTDTTMGMYTEWYRTTVNGKTFDLANHIGKGNSFDPKNTIRIAFAWDEDNKRVVVGFIGLHQRNRQS